ncbi:MAG: type II toxin-antitoxin system RelE family toxin [Candidatus Micrarchaeia archaeon]
MFRVLLGKKPQKSFEQLDEKARKRIYSVFEVLEINPWPARDFDLAKIESLEDCFRIRIGKYRVCYHVNTKAKEITVYRIEKKKDSTYK